MRTVYMYIHYALAAGQLPAGPDAAVRLPSGRYAVALYPDISMIYMVFQGLWHARWTVRMNLLADEWG
jgi:hypothetical protein